MLCLPVIHNRTAWPVVAESSDRKKFQKEQHGSFSLGRRGKKKMRGSPDSKQRQDQLSPMVPRGRVNCLCPESGDRVVMRWGGRESSPIRRRASRLAQVSLLTPTTHTHTHLLSRRFRDCRLRPDHPQEGKQTLISALQGHKLSPGLSPLHTMHNTLHTASWPCHLHLLSPELLSQMLISLVSLIA